MLKEALLVSAMTMPNTNVQVTFDAWQNKTDDASAEPLSMTRRVIGAANTHLGGRLDASEITVRFAFDDEVRSLNKQFCKKDAPTNVLSFPAAGMPGQEEAPLGDIILAYETIEKEAKEQGKRFADHTCHLILHGVLHLLGYDHDTDEKASEMETLERKILGELSISDPYGEDAHVQ